MRESDSRHGQRGNSQRQDRTYRYSASATVGSEGIGSNANSSAPPRGQPYSSHASHGLGSSRNYSQSGPHGYSSSGHDPQRSLDRGEGTSAAASAGGAVRLNGDSCDSANFPNSHSSLQNIPPSQNRSQNLWHNTVGPALQSSAPVAGVSSLQTCGPSCGQGGCVSGCTAGASIRIPTLRPVTKTVNGNMVFCCPHPGCNRTFGKQANYASHSRTHTGETPYACHLCGLQFKWQSSQKAHIRAHERRERRLSSSRMPILPAAHLNTTRGQSSSGSNEVFQSLSALPPRPAGRHRDASVNTSPAPAPLPIRPPQLPQRVPSPSVEYDSQQNGRRYNGERVPNPSPGNGGVQPIREYVPSQDAHRRDPPQQLDSQSHFTVQSAAHSHHATTLPAIREPPPEGAPQFAALEPPATPQQQPRQDARIAPLLGRPPSNVRGVSDSPGGGGTTCSPVAAHRAGLAGFSEEQQHRRTQTHLRRSRYGQDGQSRSG